MDGNNTTVEPQCKIDKIFHAKTYFITWGLWCSLVLVPYLCSPSSGVDLGLVVIWILIGSVMSIVACALKGI